MSARLPSRITVHANGSLLCPPRWVSKTSRKRKHEHRTSYSNRSRENRGLLPKIEDRGIFSLRQRPHRRLPSRQRRGRDGEILGRRGLGVVRSRGHGGRVKATFGRKVDLVLRKSVERSDNYLRRRSILSSAQRIYGT